MPSEIAFDQEEGDDDCDHLSHMVQRSDLDLVEEVVALYCLLASELLAKDEEAVEAFHPMAMVAGLLCPRKCIFHCIFHSKMQFRVELALLRTPPPLQGGREEQVASYRDEKRDDALTVHACV